MIVKLGSLISEYSVRNKDDEDIPVYSVTNEQGFCTGYFSKDVASQDRTTYKIVPRGYFAYNPSRINVVSVDVQECEDRVIVSPLYVVFSVDEKLNRRYLLHYLKSDITLTYIKSYASGSVRDNLKFSILKDFPINLPSAEEQKQIVDTLDGIEHLIALRKVEIASLDELVKSRFIELFGDPIANQFGWDTTNIGTIVTEVRYGTSRPAVENGKYPYLRMNNLTFDVHLDLKDLKRIDIPDEEIEKCIVRKGDVLFNRTNSVELVGKTCVFDLDDDMVIAGYIIRVRLNEKALPVFLSAYMNSAILKEHLRGMAKGAVNQANINARELQGIQIYLPPIELQQQFAEFVEQVEKAKQVIKEQLEQLEILKKSLMQKYFG